MTRVPAAPFFAGVRAGMAPLIVWVLHFAACYVAVAVACTQSAAGLGDLPALRAGLVAATVLALVTLVAMLWRASAAQKESHFDLLARRVCAALALVGVAWSAVPMAMLATCTA